MKAIILNAGIDKEFGECLGNKPKCMLEVENNTLLDIQINTLYKCGIEEIVIVRGYGKEYIQIPGIQYYNNDNYRETGTLYSLMQAEKELDEEVCIIYGDVICEVHTLEKILCAQGDIVVGAVKNYKNILGEHIDYNQKEMIIVNQNNEVNQIGKNLNAIDYTAIFGGIIKCSKRGAQVLVNNYNRIKEISQSNSGFNKDTIRRAWIVDFLNELAYLGVQLKFSFLEGKWMEIDTLRDYEELRRDSKFLREVIAVKTDWQYRSNTYNNINWVNNDKTLDMMVAFAGDITGKKLLDLGTGTGKVLKQFYKYYPEASYYGLDISIDMMSKIDHSMPFELYEGIVEDLGEFEDNSIDVITARMVLHHVGDLHKAFREVWRVLKKGGKFIVCEGTPPSKECLKFYEDMFKYKEERHTFLIDDLMNLYANTDFKDICAQIAILTDMSLNNWLENAGVPFRNIDIIRKKHYLASKAVKQAYNMTEKNEDIMMTWKFAVLCGQK